jgi:regulator of protease activity HflC (stomatin/prohibitin superfamily)
VVERVVPQQNAWVVERLGKFHAVLGPGLNTLIVPSNMADIISTLIAGAMSVLKSQGGAGAQQA